MEAQRYLEIMRQHMQEFYLLDAAQADDLLPGCLSTLFEHMRTLESLLLKGDAAALAKASHATRGALLNLGLFDLAAYAGEVEAQCEGGCDLAACRSLLMQLREKMQPLSELLQVKKAA